MCTHRSRDLQVNIYRIVPQEYVHVFLVCVNFANETRWYTNQEICIVDSSEVFLIFFVRKGMVMSGINYLRTSVKFVILFVEKRREIGWYATINE